MSISIEEIPQELRSDKLVTPYIQRSLELKEVEPVVSYYCKIFVLEHILENKLHTESKTNEEFTIKLLDDTEALKNSSENEDLHNVLTDKNVSFGLVFKFTYQLFNSCLEALKNYNSNARAQLIAKFRATLCFFNLFDVFRSSENEINFSKYTGGKIHSWTELEKLNKDKIKILKYQLTRLIKNEVVPAQTELDEAELEKQFDEEVANLESKNIDEEVANLESKNIDEEVANLESKNIDDNSVGPESQKYGEEDTTAAAAAKTTEKHEGNDEDDSRLDLPGAPHFLPTVSPESEEDTVKLPGAPKYLPDDDISHINKSGSIHVFPPSSPETKKPPSLVKTKSNPKHNTKPLSKENINEILNRDDVITQIQKHTKFANSALQFDDLNEAEKQLRNGLELLQILRQQENI
ncbi:hypothetical protein KGF56_004465 [Candida oxycetoniae]|uniref:Vta1 C-terminal domain-containing protein n=1 Tax=Candida oxycetoniae TaxID=497107 RepID=A0AAI9STJ9_9ASCO|nr:uncharacterized protein KGF56_004465 [Candida oxycetoniae]KAI3402791.2 hypothetical protein KGF56_004465 [Candida oxycetoniae]